MRMNQGEKKTKDIKQFFFINNMTGPGLIQPNTVARKRRKLKYFILFFYTEILSHSIRQTQRKTSGFFF